MRDSFWLIVHADTHVGYRFGLLAPYCMLDPIDEEEEGPFNPALTGTQEVLWDWNCSDFEQVVARLDDRPAYYLHVGDVCHGTFVGDVVTPRLADQPKLAAQTLMRWLHLPNVRAGWLIKGTAIHSHKHGTMELQTADLLSEGTGKPVKAWYHVELDLHGVRVDAAHKGPHTGRRKWLDGNDLRLYTRDVMMTFLENGMDPPDLLLRAHYHDRRIAHVHEHLLERTVDTWAAICPAYSIHRDDYTRNATQSKWFMNSGTLLVDVRDGEITRVFDFTHSLDLRRREVYGEHGRVDGSPRAGAGVARIRSDSSHADGAAGAEDEAEQGDDPQEAGGEGGDG